MKTLITTLILLISTALHAAPSGVAMSGVVPGGGGGGGYQTPTYVQSNSGYSSGPATLGSSATSGNLIAVLVSGNSTVASTTLSGGGVSSWIPGTEIQDTTNDSYSRWYWGLTTGGSVSITIGTAPSDPGWSVHEYSGVTSVMDVQAGAQTDADTTWTSGSATTTQANDLLLGSYAIEADPGTVTWDAGWTKRTEQTGHYHSTADRVAATVGNYEASGTSTNSLYGAANIIAIKAASN